MKKFFSSLAIILCLLLSVSLIACEKEKITSPDTEEKSEQASQETSTQTDVETTAESTAEATAQSPEETKTESSTETSVESSENTNTESSEDTNTESSESTNTESSEDTNTESSESTNTESSEDTSVESSEETTEEDNTEAHEHSYGEITYDEEYHWYPATCEHKDEVKDKGAHTYEDGVCTVCNKNQFSYTVTEEQWKALFRGDNATVYYKTSSINQSFKFDGNKIYTYMEYYGDGLGMFHEVETDESGNEIWWEYAEDAFEGDWAKYLDEEGNGGRMRDVLSSNLHPFADTFGFFKYDEENKKYAADSVTITADGSSYTYTNATATFENGRLTEFSYYLDSTHFLINEIGTTSVELPVIAYEVTEEEWKAIVVGDDLKNLRIEAHGTALEDEEFVGHRMWEYTESKACLYDLCSGERTVAKVDGVWYKIDLDYDIGYVGVAATEEEIIAEFYFAGVYGSQLKNDFSKFTFDAESNCYVATDYTFGDKVCDEFKLYIRNGKIVMIEETGSETINNETLTVTYVYEFRSYGRVKDDHIYVPDFTVQE